MASVNHRRAAGQAPGWCHLAWALVTFKSELISTVWFHSSETSGTGRSKEMESRLVGAEGWRLGEGEERPVPSVGFLQGGWKMTRSKLDTVVAAQL